MYSACLVYFTCIQSNKMWKDGRWRTKPKEDAATKPMQPSGLTGYCELFRITWSLAFKGFGSEEYYFKFSANILIRRNMISCIFENQKACSCILD